MRTTLPTLALTSLLGLAQACARPATPRRSDESAPVRIDVASLSRELCFAENEGIYLAALRLARDGRYEKLWQDDLGPPSRRVDEGRWTQLAPGSLALDSERLLRGVRAGDLEVLESRRDASHTLERVRAELAAFLAARADASFGANEVVRLSIFVRLQVPRVGRRELEALLGAIDTELATTVRNRFFVTVVGHRGHRWLVESGDARDVDELVREIDRRPDANPFGLWVEHELATCDALAARLLRGAVVP